MLRRTLSSLLLAFGLVAGSLGFTCFWLQETLFAPERTEALAAGVLESPLVRDLVVDRLVDAGTMALPEAARARVPESQVRAAAETAVEDPRFVAAFADALLQLHRRAVGEAEGPVQLDASGVTAALSAGLKPVSPEAAAALGSRPVQITLPVENAPDLGWLNRLTASLVSPLVTAALGLVAASFLVARRRDVVMRRVGRWLLALVVFQAVFFWAVPRFLLPALGGEWATLLGTLISSFGAGLVSVLVVLAGAGFALVFASRLLAPTGRPPRRRPGPPVVKPPQGSAPPRPAPGMLGSGASQRQR